MAKPSAQPLIFTVPFDEADGEGIVFFGNYFRLAHRALEQYLPTVGIAWEEWFKHETWGVPLRHVEADYLQPLRPGEKFSVNIQVEQIGDSSVTFSYDFRNFKDQPAARLKTTHVFADRSTFKKQSIPDSIRQHLG